MKKNTLNHVLVDAMIAIAAGLAIFATTLSTGNSLTGDLTQKCGNGVRQGNEQCDDGNTKNGDGCNIVCKLEPGFKCMTNSQTRLTVCKGICGNGEPQGTEQCDDGNTQSGDGCSPVCKYESQSVFDCIAGTHPTVCRLRSCGGGGKQGSEECDDNNNYNDDGCSGLCKLEPGFTCTTNNETHASVCHVICGNGTRNGTEECDDTNTQNGDGCNSNCELEPGFDCFNHVQGSVCERSTCGNGKREGFEQCDDGNSQNDDGCNQDCETLDYFQCSDSSPNVCYQCGDGTQEGAEECDDGNNDTQDRCGPVCNIENDLIKKNIGGNVFETSSDNGCNDNAGNEHLESCRQYEALYGHGRVRVQYHLNSLSSQKFIRALLLPTSGKPLQEKAYISPEGKRVYFSTEIKQFEGKKYAVKGSSTFSGNKRNFDTLWISWYSGHRDIEIAFFDLPENFNTKLVNDLVYAYLKKHGSDLQIQTTSPLPKP